MVSALGSRVGWTSARKERTNERQTLEYCACVYQLSDWLAEKMLAAQDETYRDAKNIHSKWMRHQAFESEIKSNKDRLERLIKEANDLIEQKPELAKVPQ